jgi:hypothetical protein
VLLFIPFITDYIENGQMPQRPRQWITEITMTLILIAVISYIYRQQYPAGKDVPHRSSHRYRQQ